MTARTPQASKSSWPRRATVTCSPASIQRGNVWTFANVVTGGPTPYFDVWAVDNANNSGELLPVGNYHLQLPCLEDQTPPTIVQDFSVTSYFDERSMQLASSAIPPQYTWQSALPSAVGPGVDGAIWKSSVRLSWGVAQPTGASSRKLPTPTTFPLSKSVFPLIPQQTLPSCR